MSIADIKRHLEGSEHNWVIEETENGLVIESDEGVVAHLVTTEQQMLIESLLFPIAQVKDKATFDHAMMLAQKQLPLTSVGISQIDDKQFYCAFGSLSAQSTLDNIELEILMLYRNINELLHFSNDFLQLTH